MVENTHDDGVGADGLTGTGCAGDDHVRQPCDVANNTVSGDISAHGKGELAAGIAEVIALQNFPQGDGVLVAVGDFDADGRLAGNWRFDTDTLRCQREGDIIRQTGDLRNLDTGGGLNFIACDRRPSGDAGDADGHAKAVERVHQNAGLFLQLLLRSRVVGTADARLEEVHGRNLIGLLQHGRLGHCQFRCAGRLRLFFGFCQLRRGCRPFLRCDNAGGVSVCGDGQVNVHVVRLALLRSGIPNHGFQLRGEVRLCLRRRCCGRRLRKNGVGLCCCSAGHRRLRLLRQEDFRLFCRFFFRCSVLRPLRIPIPKLPQLAERQAYVAP